MFVTGKAPTIDEIIEAMDEYELVLPAARAHHYSNLAYGLLGEVVAAASGDAVHRLRRRADPRAARPRPDDLGTSRSRAPLGYLVDEYAGTAAREPHMRHGRRRRDGAALVDGRRPLPVGRRSSPRAARASSTRPPRTRCGRRR